MSKMALLTTLETSAPQRLKMSYEDYLNFAGDAKIMEWVHGEALIYRPPVHEHQKLVLFLGELLNAFIQFFDLGTLILSPFKVKLWPAGPAREPDIIFVRPENRANLTPKRFEGAPTY
jgi:Uma2 family endonuclease